MKPSPELLDEWFVKAKVAQMNNDQPGVYEHTLAEFAAQWGAEQAIKNHILLSALESAKAHMQDGEPHTLTMHITRKGDALVADALAVTKGTEQAQQTTDAARILEWMRTPNRKQANLAFTEGPERQAAYWVEIGQQEMQAHYAAGVRAGGQDAKLLIGFMSPKQIGIIRDPDEDPDGDSGEYIPLRKTAAGSFTLALYAAMQGGQQ